MANTSAPVIVLGSTKGGTGKTTLTACLSVEAAKDSRTVIIDADPQQSLARWHELRRQHDDTNNPGLYKTSDEPLEVKVDKLRRAGVDWIFIDLPPGDIDLLEAGISVADLVVLPIRASPLDVEAIRPAVELSLDYVKPHVVVINAFEPSWKISATVGAYCERAGLDMLKTTVGQRQAYTGAMVSGDTGPEHSDPRQARVCAAEIKALWDEIRTLVLHTSGRG